MPGLETRGFGGSGVGSQVGLIVIALLAGLLVPLGAVAYLAAHDPQPRSCRTGVASSTRPDGVVVWASAGVLWYADGDLGHGRRLVDYASVRAAGPRPNPSAPGPSASPSPPPLPSPAFEAAAIYPDRKTVAFLVSNPPDEPGMVSLRVVSAADSPGTTPLEPGNWPWLRGSTVRSEVSVLSDRHILFTTPHDFGGTETDKVLVGVAEAGSTIKVDEADPKHTFLQTDHAVWPELKNYKLPPALPHLPSRVLARNGLAAGVLTHHVSTVLSSRALHEVVRGRAGSPTADAVCAIGDPLETVAFAPDGHSVALVTEGNTEVLDLDGSHALAQLVHGRLFDWRP